MATENTTEFVEMDLSPMFIPIPKLDDELEVQIGALSGATIRNLAYHGLKQLLNDCLADKSKMDIAIPERVLADVVSGKWTPKEVGRSPWTVAGRAARLDKLTIRAIREVVFAWAKSKKMKPTDITPELWAGAMKALPNDPNVKAQVAIWEAAQAAPVDLGFTFGK